MAYHWDRYKFPAKARSPHGCGRSVAECPQGCPWCSKCILWRDELGYYLCECSKAYLISAQHRDAKEKGINGALAANAVGDQFEVHAHPDGSTCILKRPEVH
jgi:hypothetical protein